MVLPPDLERLFQDTQAIDEESNSAYVYCKCGTVNNPSLPMRCPGCGDVKAWWRTLEGKVLKLSQMSIGHITNSVRMLGDKLEKLGPTSPLARERYEIALDILYAELGTRDKEIAQDTGILAALNKASDRSD